MTEFRPGRFQILPTVIKNLIIINVLVFIAQTTLKSQFGDAIDNTFALHNFQSPLFKPWQLVTYLFMHGGFDHIFFNMFALWMFGATLENLWGPKRFLTFYMVCGLGAAFIHLIVLYFETRGISNDFMVLKSNFDVGHFLDFVSRHHNGFNQQKVTELITEWQAEPGNNYYQQIAIESVNDYVNVQLNNGTIGASGAVFGVLAAFGYLFPNDYLYIYFLVPVKVKWAISAYIVIELFTGIKNSAGDNVAHFAHLGGALFGLILVYYWNKTNRRNFY
jgi:membrane associated rhomboid family serine protease